MRIQILECKVESLININNSPTTTEKVEKRNKWKKRCINILKKKKKCGAEVVRHVPFVYLLKFIESKILN